MEGGVVMMVVVVRVIGARGRLWFSKEGVVEGVGGWKKRGGSMRRGCRL